MMAQERRRPGGAPGRVLVAGIGNIFLGDDGFGVEVVHRLRAEGVGERMDIVDFGIRGIHLAYELTGGAYDGIILVDAMARGGAPGTLYALEPEGAAAAAPAETLDAHGLTPDAVLQWIGRLGGCRGRIVVVGCEPASTEESMGLSPAVAAAVDGAARLVRQLAGEMGGG